MKQVSAGGVIVRGAGAGAATCLIARHDGARRVWCLPKGHLEPGETLKVCALREVREETGLTGAVVANLGAITYTFAVSSRGAPRGGTLSESRAKSRDESKGGTRISKTVHFYLMRYRRGRPDGHDDEVEEAAWFPIADAQKRLAYPGERRILLKARRYLKTAVHCTR